MSAAPERRPLAYDVDAHPVIGALKEGLAATWLLYGLVNGAVPEEHERAIRVIALDALAKALTEAEAAYRAHEADGNLRTWRTP